MEVSGQLHAPANFTPGKTIRYTLSKRVGGPQTVSGRFGAVRKICEQDTEILTLNVVVCLSTTAEHNEA